MESIIGLYKTEPSTTDVFHAGPLKTLVDVEYATAAWVDWWNHPPVSLQHRPDLTSRARARLLRCPQPRAAALVFIRDAPEGQG